MTDHEKYLLRQSIASMIDFPSVYMGGPSVGSTKKAIKIIQLLEEEWGLTAVPAERIKQEINLVASWRKSPWDSLERI